MYVHRKSNNYIVEKSGNWRLSKVRQNCQLLPFVHEALARPPPIKKPPLFSSIQNANTTSIHTSSGLNNNVFFGDKDITRGTLSIPTYTESVLKVIIHYIYGDFEEHNFYLKTLVHKRAVA